MRLKEKVVLITASTRGIGLACVKACARKVQLSIWPHAASSGHRQPRIR